MKNTKIQYSFSKINFCIFAISLIVVLTFRLASAQNIDIDVNGTSTPDSKATPKQNISPAPAQSTDSTPRKASPKANSEAAVVKKVEVSTDNGEIRIDITGENLDGLTVDKISNQKLLIKLKNTRLEIPAKIKTGNDVVQTIRSSVHPGRIAWIVLDVAKVKAWKSSKTENGYSVVLNPDQNAAKKNAIETEDQDKSISIGKKVLSRLIDVSFKPVDRGIKIVLTSDGPSKYTVRKLSKPEKLVIRFHDTKMEIAEKLKRFKNEDVELQKGGLVDMELRQIGPPFSPISEAILTIVPGTVSQIDRDLNQIVISLSGPAAIEKKVEKKGNINQLISMDVTGADLNAVIRTLATEAGFDVEFPFGPLGGTVNEKLKDIPMKTALGTLLSPGGYDYEIQGNTLRIAPLAALRAGKTGLPHETELISPSGGMTPASFDNLVRSILKPSNAVTSTPDTIRNVLILYGTPSDIEDYKRTIRDLKLDESSSSDRITRVIELNYADPVQTITLLSPYLTPVGKVQQVIGPQNAPQNKLVIWETATNMGVLLELIKEIDIKPPQVLIESNIVEVDDEKDLNLGVSWSAVRQNGDPTVNTSFVGLPASAAIPPGNFTFGTLKSGLNISATLEALQTHKKGKIISRPRIATESGIPAEINAVETVIVTSQSQTAVPGVGITTQVTFTSLPLPIDLKVTPRITDDGRITTVINATVTSQTGPAVAGPGGTTGPPPTSTQTATTTITTKNGETIVIGGLVRDTVSETVNGIPLLSNIPIIGSLFEQNEKQDVKVELVIFITPTLLEE